MHRSDRRRRDTGRGQDPADELSRVCPGTSVYDSQNRQRVIDLDVPVEIAGVRFSPGDLVFADIDGVVVVPHEVEEEAIQRAWDKVHAENRTRGAIRGG